MATLDVGNVPYTVGFKVCMYTVPPEYGEYGSSRWAPLANALDEMGYLMYTPLTPCGVVLNE